MRTFADIPGEVGRRVSGGERVVLILLDAFGLEFLGRHRDHPLVERLEVTPLASQFPSTTTAHVTTVHFGAPVEDHGLYEWNILEPSLDAIICPLRFTAATSDVEGSLAAWLDPSVLAPGPTVYETLGVPSLVLQPEWITGSTYSRLATVGARVVPFSDVASGLQALADAFTSSPELRYGFLYWDLIDSVGHQFGPQSPEFAAAARTALTAVWSAFRSVEDVTVLITADHGQVPVSPDRVDYLDEIWPELPEFLSHGRPAGSSRDAFLHVKPSSVQRVIDELATRLGDRADVRPAAELFDRIGPRLKERLGDVVVLPAAGRQAWLHAAAAHEQWFLGQHGGQHPNESTTYLAQLQP